MTTAFYLLLAIGLLGAFDVVYFHVYRCRLRERPECQREVRWHTARHLVYALQFLWVPHLRFHGAALAVLCLLYAADVFVAWADVWEEGDSRAPQGGLPRGEYFMHVVLSLLVGLYLMSVFQAVWPDRLLPAAVRIAPPEVPAVLRSLMTAMGLVALGTFAMDLRSRRLPSDVSPGPRPPASRVVVEVFIPAPVERVWERTQSAELHVGWDLRFSAIRMLPERTAQGFQVLDYRTRLGFGVEVAGWGRYLQNVPLARSTFEFGSEDPKSLITRGRGIWLYESRAGGTHFKTVFDYQTRHGVVGERVDAFLFRPLMRLATEWSFETLRLGCAGDEDAVARRRSRWRFAAFALARALGWAPAPESARSWLGSGREVVTVPSVALASARGRA
ncbi:SRPBCC family protein [Myxococcaceae bacterium GXIMD 01537]